MLRRLIFTVALMSAASLTFAEAVRISGFVSGSANGTKFTLGSSKGRFTVESAGAKVTLNGRTFDASKLTGGSQVTVEGELSGKTIRAKTVVVGNLRGAPASPVKPNSKPSASTSSDPRKPAKPATSSTKSKPSQSTGKTTKPKGKRDDLPTDVKPTDRKRGPMPAIGKVKPKSTSAVTKPKSGDTKATSKAAKSTSASSTAKTKPKSTKPSEKPKSKPKSETPVQPSRSDGR